MLDNLLYIIYYLIISDFYIFLQRFFVFLHKKVEEGVVVFNLCRLCFQTAGAYGYGDRIPTHSFTIGPINHGDGYFTKTHPNGQTLKHVYTPGQYRPATCSGYYGC
jgi:hypothetical protein